MSNRFSPMPSTGAPFVFQPSSNAMSTLNPLLQPPSSMIQPAMIRPPAISSAFSSPPSAFTSLIPSNHQQATSLIQPKLTIGNQPSPFIAMSSLAPLSMPNMSSTQTMETTNNAPTSTIVPPTTHDTPIGQSNAHVLPHSSSTSSSSSILATDAHTSLAPPPPPPPPPSQQSSSSST
jgi:hypothetical protein